MTKEEREQYKKEWGDRLRALAANNPEFQAKMSEYRRRLNKNEDDAFESTEEADNFLNDVLKTDPYWTGITTDERGRLIQQADPLRTADYDAAVADKRNGLQAAAAQLGFALSPDQLDSMADQAYREGWNENDIRIHLRPLADAAIGQSDDNQGFSGRIGSAAAQLSDWASLNGISLDQTSADQFISSIAFQDKTMEQVKQELRNTYMIGAFPGWADQIKAGIDISTLANPYKDVAQRMLGRPNIQMNDPLMQELMQVQGPDGQFKARPLWETERYIRNLDEWQYGDDAAMTYARGMKAVSAMFGFG